MRGLLGFCVKRDRFWEIPLLAIAGGQNRIQVKVIRIELECPLTFDNGIINAVIRQIGSAAKIARDRRHRIQFLSFEDKSKTLFQLTAEERVQTQEKVRRCRVRIELERAG